MTEKNSTGSEVINIIKKDLQQRNYHKSLVNHLNDELNKANDHIKKVEALNIRIYKVTESSELENEALRDHIDELNTQYQSESQSLQGRIEELEGQYKSETQSLQGRIEELEGQYKSETQSLQGKIRELEGQYESERQKVKNLGGELESKVQSETKYQAEIKILQDNINKLKEHNTKHLFFTGHMLSKHKSLKNEVKKLIPDKGLSLWEELRSKLNTAITNYNLLCKVYKVGFVDSYELFHLSKEIVYITHSERDCDFFYGVCKEASIELYHEINRARDKSESPLIISLRAGIEPTRPVIKTECSIIYLRMLKLKYDFYSLVATFMQGYYKGKGANIDTSSHDIDESLDPLSRISFPSMSPVENIKPYNRRPWPSRNKTIKIENPTSDYEDSLKKL